MTQASSKETKPTSPTAHAARSRAAGRNPPQSLPQVAPPTNSTGLPNALKTSVEHLSGLSLDAVRVHYNSEKPAQVKAHAYTQGTEIHVARGRESSLPHEAWHVVQQLEGRVKPNVQFKGRVPGNDDAALENEADAMGDKAVALSHDGVLLGGKSEARAVNSPSTNVMQRDDDDDDDDVILYPTPIHVPLVSEVIPSPQNNDAEEEDELPPGPSPELQDLDPEVLKNYQLVPKEKPRKFKAKVKKRAKDLKSKLLKEDQTLASEFELPKAPKAEKKKKGESDTISQSLKIAGTAFRDVENVAMQTEKLYYAFSEDRDYVTIVLSKFSEADFDVLIEEIDHDMAVAPTKEEQHELAEQKKYAQKFKDAKARESELESADKRTENAKILMADAYKARTEVMMRYAKIQSYREAFSESGKNLDEDGQFAKNLARQECKRLATEAAVRTEQMEKRYKELKQEKLKLTEAQRIAPEAAEQFGLWLRIKGFAKLKNIIVDFGVGLLSSGVLSYEVETDKRGFQASGEFTNVVSEAIESAKKIKNEYNVLQSIETVKVSELFKGLNIFVGILQTLDRVLLRSIRRVIRFLSYEMGILSSFGVVVFAPIAAITSAISGLIALVQMAINSMIVGARGLQLWFDDHTVANVLSMSLAKGAVNGVVSFLKFGVNILEDEGYLGNNADLAVYKGELQNDDEDVYGPQVGLDSMGVDMGIKFGKSLFNEYLKAKHKPTKNIGKIVKGDLTGNFPDESIPDENVLLMFQAAMDEVVTNTKGFTSPVKDLQDKLADGNKEIKAGGEKAKNQISGDPKLKEKGKKSLESVKDSGKVMDESSDLLRDLLALT